jgi:hypothetical protein
MCFLGVEATTINVRFPNISPSIGTPTHIYVFIFSVWNKYIFYYFMWSANIYIQHTHMPSCVFLILFHFNLSIFHGAMRVMLNVIPLSYITVNLLSLMVTGIYSRLEFIWQKNSFVVARVHVLF